MALRFYLPVPSNRSFIYTASRAKSRFHRDARFITAFQPILRPSSSFLKVQAATSSHEVDSSNRNSLVQIGQLSLENLRESLIRQEDILIYNLIERAQYCFNAPTYDSNNFEVRDFDGSLVEFMMRETEMLHAKIRRYCCPDEHPFYPGDLPEAIIPRVESPQVLHPAASFININPQIWKVYFKNLLPALVSEGDDGNYGSTAVCDVLCLQALSRRIHFGKFVAEAKFVDSPSTYRELIMLQDSKLLMEHLTFKDVEDRVIRRVEKKAMAYSQEINVGGDKNEPKYKINPELIGKLYDEWVMPLTKQVQVEYLLRRLS